MLSLIMPVYGGHLDNLTRTIDSFVNCGAVDDVVIVSTHPDLDQAEECRKLGFPFIELPWSHTLLHGFSSLYNIGAKHCKNDWVLRMDVAETLISEVDLSKITKAPIDTFFCCTHPGMSEKWGRVWNRHGVYWRGYIHESPSGDNGGVIFEMLDIPKVPMDDPIKNDSMRWLKSVLYNTLQEEVYCGKLPIEGTDIGWIEAWGKSKKERRAFLTNHFKMVSAMKSNDWDGFLKEVGILRSLGVPPYGCDFNPTGSSL